jgi:hypothetical protein
MVDYPMCSEHRGPWTLPPPCLAIYRPGQLGNTFAHLETGP